MHWVLELIPHSHRLESQCHGPRCPDRTTALLCSHDPDAVAQMQYHFDEASSRNDEDDLIVLAQGICGDAVEGFASQRARTVHGTLHNSHMESCGHTSLCAAGKERMQAPCAASQHTMRWVSFPQHWETLQRWCFAPALTFL